MARAAITALKGNIVAQMDCDGIVNSANAHLIAGSGVCGAIYKAAGPQLEPYTAPLAPLHLGEALASPAFELGCRYIIHTRGPKYFEDPDPPANLAKCIRNAIALADQTGLVRLAVPAISTGVYGYPVAEAVPIMVKAAYETAGTVTCLEEIRFVVVSDDLLELFQRALSALIDVWPAG